MKRLLPWSILVLVVVVTIAVVLPTYTTSRAQDKASGNELQQSLVQLAEARLKLAETELQIAQADNKRVPGVVAEVVVARLELGAAKAKARLAIAQQKPGEYSLEVLVPSAELTVQLLTARAKKLDEIAARTGDQIAINEAQRTRAQLEVAKLELVSLKGMKGRPQSEQLQFQIEQMGATLDSINSRVTVLEDRR